jgi:hypothetical protein
MHQGSYVFAQLMKLLPWHTFRRLVKKYDGERYVKGFSCVDQFLCLAFARITGRESLRDIEICLRSHQGKLFHLGFRSPISRSTLADANASRDWRIHAEFAQALLAQVRRAYVHDAMGEELGQAAYALDSSTIDVCLNLFPWAPAMHEGCGGIKLHTVLDLHSALPDFVDFSPSRQHDVHLLDRIAIEPGAIYVMDRGYLDFERLFRLHCAGAHFLMRAKKNLRFNRRYSHRVENRAHVICDQTVVLSRSVARADYPQPLRRLRLRDAERDSSIVLLTNQFQLSASAIGELYRHRWQIEVFFKWIKQHLRIKAFYGTSPNAVKTQVWVAMAIYALIALLKKRWASPASPYEFIQILSVTLFEKTPINMLFSASPSQVSTDISRNQLILFGD